VSPDTAIAIVFGLVGALVSFAGVVIACLTLRFMMRDKCTFSRSSLTSLGARLASTYLEIDVLSKQMRKRSERLMTPFFDTNIPTSFPCLRDSDLGRGNPGSEGVIGIVYKQTLGLLLSSALFTQQSSVAFMKIKLTLSSYRFILSISIQSSLQPSKVSKNTSIAHCSKYCLIYSKIFQSKPRGYMLCKYHVSFPIPS
jgi:hypothetical protein